MDTKAVKLTQSEVDKKRLEIMTEFRKGGKFTHNVIQHELMTLAKTNKSDADTIYHELIDAGY